MKALTPEAANSLRGARAARSRRGRRRPRPDDAAAARGGPAGPGRSRRRPTGGSTDVSAAPVDSGSAGFIAYINNGGTRHLHPDFGGTLDDGVIDLRLPVRRRRRQPAEEDRAVRRAGRERRRRLTRPRRSYPFYPIPDAAITQPHWVEGGDPGNIDDTGDQDRHLLIVDRDHRYLYELYNVWWDGVAVAGVLGRVLRPEHQRPPARRLDVGRRRGPRDPAGPRALRRGLRAGRDPPRLPLHGAPHATATSTRRRTWRGSRTRRRCRWARACG